MNLSELSRHYADSIEQGLQRMRYSLRRQGYSHQSEESILNKHIADLLPVNHSRTAVDIGAGNGVRWSNTYSLFLNGWKGIGIEADSRKFVQLQRAYKNLPNVVACNEAADAHNIVSLLKSAGTEHDFGVLSLDIDGNDYWVLKAILREFRPQLIVTEINEKIPPPLRFLLKETPNPQLRHHFYGYSIAVLEDLCAEFDYGVLELEYNNAFIAPRELKAGRFVDVATAYEHGYRDRSDRKQRFPSNLDMEVLQSLSVEKGLKFLNEFYTRENGNYYLAGDRETLKQQLQS
jgi:hypothetical protein